MKKLLFCTGKIQGGSFSKETLEHWKLLIIFISAIIQLQFTESSAQTSVLPSMPRTSDSILFPQQKITGKVTDKSGNPLRGVTVAVKRTVIGTTTDENGNFSLELPPGAEIITFSFVGMVTQEVKIGNQVTFNVALEESVTSLDEVVIVGYGVQKKVNVTGAVSDVKFQEAVSSRPVLNASTALEGLTSGVTLQQAGGWPGRSDQTSIYIRGIGTLGTSYPLIIVDGMQADLPLINPRDIESVSVLKDAASAAIYGSRAANGVILITTKNGEGRKLSISYNGVFSISQPVNLLDFVSDYTTYMRLYNESRRNIGLAEQFSQSTISAWETANKYPDSLNAIGVPNYVAFPNTDWNREMYHNSIARDQNLSISGSTQNINAFASLGFYNNPGLLDHTGLKRYYLRLNLDAQINKWIKIGTRTWGQLSNYGMGNYKDMNYNIYRTNPGIYPVFNGLYGSPEATEENQNSNNPYIILETYTGKYSTLGLNTTIYGQVNFTKGLTLDLNLDYGNFSQDMYYHNNPNIARCKFSTGEILVPQTLPENLSTYTDVYNVYAYTIENLLRYKVAVAKKHNISILAGYSQTYFFRHNQVVNKKGLADESAWVFDAATENVSITGNAYDYAFRSWFGRINYDFDSRYLFEANLRYDGSSRFNPERRYGLFPSFSAGWRISEEKFLKNSGLVQNLKIRASWGKLGNSTTPGNYDYQSFYNPVNYSFNGTQSLGLYAQKISNPLLKWESTTVSNVGLDAALFKNRLSAETDAYYKITDGILTTLPIYLTMGLKTPPTENSAAVYNRGIEITIGWKDQVDHLKYSISANLGYNINKVTKYKGKLVEGWLNGKYTSNLGDVSRGDQYRILEDHLINEHYLYQVYTGDGTYFNADSSVNIAGGPRDGMIRTPQDMAWLDAMIADGYTFSPNTTNKLNPPDRKSIWYGDYIYADLNGDSIYGNSYDRRFTGSSAMPKITFSSQMNISWKNFELSLIWFGLAGFKLYWLENGYNSSYTPQGWQIGKMVAGDHYYYNDSNPADSTNNITASFPRLKNISDSQNTIASTRWLYSGAFLRLKNLTFSYTIPEKITNKIFAKQIRIYFSVENLFTITSFPGLDPEMGGNTGYPIMRQIALGINITL